MLNFNSIDNNSNAYAMPLSGGNFTQVPTTVAQMNYLNNSNNLHGLQQSSTWSRAENLAHNNNCNETNSLAIDVVRSDQQKDYLQTAANEGESEQRSALENMGSYLQQKGSENVKRFSVNNLLQLANNCRALANEQRHTVAGKCEIHDQRRTFLMIFPWPFVLIINRI